MGVKEDFMEKFDTGYEAALPKELLEHYSIIERLNAAEYCDTLLVQKKADKTLHVAKCYLNEGGFETGIAALAAKIGSPSVPHYGDEYKNERYCCIIREYVEGVTLTEYARTNILSREEIVRIATELAGAMKFLHESDPVIIHRDIKPDNIIIRADKSLVLIDFGISRIYKEGSGSDTVFCGTRNYAPPEQYGFMQTDIRSDIYSFGVVLSWFLTGKEEPIQNPQFTLERIAAKSCAYAPDRRYQDDAALLRALRKTTREYVRKRKKGFLAAGVAAIFLTLAVACPLFLYRALPYRFEEPLIEEAVRLSLKKPNGFLTRQDLGDVRALYIFQDRAYADEDAYYAALNAWYATSERLRGTTAGIEDLAYMKNLQHLYLSATIVEDLSPLRGLKKLERVCMQENKIRDLSPLSDKPLLETVLLMGNHIGDIGPVRTWPAVMDLNLSYTSKCDGSPLKGLNDLRDLEVLAGPDLTGCLDGLHVSRLALGWTGQMDLECLRGVSDVGSLIISDSTIRDLSALAGREDVWFLEMKHCDIDDLSPLFTMPNLSEVVVSPDMREDMKALETLEKEYGEALFEVKYEE